MWTAILIIFWGKNEKKKKNLDPTCQHWHAKKIIVSFVKIKPFLEMDKHVLLMEVSISILVCMVQALLLGGPLLSLSSCVVYVLLL